MPLGVTALVLAAPRGQLVSAQGLNTPSAMERLASPTLPANPGQADRGAIDYWLNCSPCHGDRGQGLTDEFRKGVYPTEDQNCWLAGCHGRRYYPNGWTIPAYVPALIGPGALGKFGNASVLEAFISLKMPFQKPGSLSADTYWRLTAFLLRQNGYWSGNGILDPATAERVRIPAALPDASRPLPTLVDTPTPRPNSIAPVEDQSGSLAVRIISVVLLLAMGLGFFFLIRFKKV